jgi:hypothetical protein
MPQSYSALYQLLPAKEMSPRDDAGQHEEKPAPPIATDLMGYCVATHKAKPHKDIPSNDSRKNAQGKRCKDIFDTHGGYSTEGKGSVPGAKEEGTLPARVKITRLGL